MYLTVYYDGQFWIGMVEFMEDDTLMAFRYLFGSEPKDSEILQFIHAELLKMLSLHKQNGVKISHHKREKLNPKRMQRLVSKEMKTKCVSTKAEQATKLELEARKKAAKQQNKEKREEFKARKYAFKKQKAKKKHREK